MEVYSVGHVYMPFFSYGNLYDIIHDGWRRRRRLHTVILKYAIYPSFVYFFIFSRQLLTIHGCRQAWLFGPFSLSRYLTSLLVHSIGSFMVNGRQVGSV